MRTLLLLLPLYPIIDGIIEESARVNALDQEFGDKEEWEKSKGNQKTSLCSCFGRIRLASSIDACLRETLNSHAKMGRVDRLLQVVRRKAGALCSDGELEQLDQLLLQLKPGSDVAAGVIASLSDLDKDRLNTWANLGDTESMRVFYLAKFQELDDDRRARLQSAFSTLAGFLIFAPPPPSLQSYVTKMNSEQFKQIKDLQFNKDVVVSEPGGEGAADIDRFLAGVWDREYTKLDPD